MMMNGSKERHEDLKRQNGDPCAFDEFCREDDGQSPAGGDGADCIDR